MFRKKHGWIKTVQLFARERITTLVVAASLIVPVICYTYIALFGAAAIRRRVLIQVPPEIPPA